jgi:replicative DNA helicase Mcm
LAEFFRVYTEDEILRYVNNESSAVEIEHSKLELWDLDFADQLITDPVTSIELLENTLHDNIFIADIIDIQRESGIIEKPKIEIINLPNTLEVEQVRKVQYLGKFVQVKGRTSLQNLSKAQATITAFQCMRCEHITYVTQSFDSKLVEPKECESEVCGRNGPFRLLAQPETVFVNTQIITLESPKGQVDIKVALQGHQCEPPWVRDGKIVTVTGVLLHTSIYQRSGKRSDFEYILLANSIRLADESTTLPPTEDEISMFEEWAKEPEDLRARIVESIAPHIYGYQVEKAAASLSLFSDWTWDYDPMDVVARSSIHVLFLGDPGVAKSQIMKDLLYLSPKSKYAQIVGSTPGGLANSAIQKDGEWFIKAGLFSHADQGVMGLDEIDKFRNKDDVNCLINVLEEQIQVVSKAGITEVHFNGRTAVIATANPSRGNLNKFDPILDQTDLPLYIMQRFDLIFVIFDIPDKVHDTEVAHAVYMQHKDTQNKRQDIERVIDPDLFRKYVLYARTKSAPEIPEPIETILSDYYLSIRGRHQETKDPLISARSLNNLFRVARAIARRELATCVTETHARLAISITRSSIQSLSLGVEDHSVTNFGSTKSQRERISDIRSAIMQICKNKESATVADIVFVKGLDETEVEYTIQTMKRKGELLRIGGGYRLV